MRMLGANSWQHKLLGSSCVSRSRSMESQACLAATASGVDLFDISSHKRIRTACEKESVKFMAPADQAHVVLCVEVRAGKKDDISIVNWRTGKVKMRMPMKHSFRSMASSTRHSHACCCARNYLAAADGNGRVYLWDFTTGWMMGSFEAHYKAVTAMSFSQCGTFLFTGGEDAIVNSWSVGEIIRLGPSEALTPFRSFASLHTLTVTGIVHEKGGTSSSVVTVGMDGVVSVINPIAVQKPASLWRLSCVSGTGRFIYCGCKDGSLRRIRTQGGVKSRPSSSSSSPAALDSKEDMQIDVHGGHTAAITGVNLSWEESQVIHSSRDGTLIIRDAYTMQLLQTIKTGKPSVLSSLVLLDERSLTIDQLSPEDEEKKAKFPPLKRDFDPSRRYPPLVKICPTPKLRKASSRDEPRLLELLASLEQAESAEEGMADSGFLPLAKSNQEAVVRSQSSTSPPSRKRREGKEEEEEEEQGKGIIPHSEEGKESADDVAALRSELEKWRRAGKELYELVASKALDSLAGPPEHNDNDGRSDVSKATNTSPGKKQQGISGRKRRKKK
eukprot:jgi/Bigna1/72748/fgenesh1_pg.21_\